MNKLELTVKQKLHISTKIITSLQIMSFNTMELYSFLEKESEENIFIDYDFFFENKLFRDYIGNKHIPKENRLTKSENIENEIDFLSDSYEPTLTEILLEQLGTSNLDYSEQMIGRIIIYSLDKDGYLRDDLEEIAKNTGEHIEKIEKVLAVIQSFEPMGIGARNIKECLINQTSDYVTKKFIKEHLDDIYKNDIGKIAKKENISIDEVKEIIENIKKLNPKPSSGYKINSYEMHYIYPDIFVDFVEGDISITVKESISNIHANTYYLDLLDKDIDEYTRDYLKKKLTRTMLIIESVEKRKQTIQQIANIILTTQKNHIMYDEPLETLMIKDIANRLDISESTVSRAVRHKYVQTPKKTYKLKNLLSLGSQNSDNISKDYIKNQINEIISRENKKKPLSDEKITDMLNQQDIDIKRRTVAKYRDEMGIQPAKLRKIY